MSSELPAPGRSKLSHSALDSCVTTKPASVRPWKKRLVMRVSYVGTLSRYTRWYATCMAICTNASGDSLCCTIRFLPNSTNSSTCPPRHAPARARGEAGRFGARLEIQLRDHVGEHRLRLKDRAPQALRQRPLPARRRPAPSGAPGAARGGPLALRGPAGAARGRAVEDGVAVVEASRCAKGSSEIASAMAPLRAAPPPDFCAPALARAWNPPRMLSAKLRIVCVKTCTRGPRRAPQREGRTPEAHGAGGAGVRRSRSGGRCGRRRPSARS